MKMVVIILAFSLAACEQKVEVKSKLNWADYPNAEHIIYGDENK